MIPDEVIAHFMVSAGVDTSVPLVLRIFGNATQKFISDIGSSALQFHVERNNLNLEDPNMKLTLKLEDLAKALEDYDDAMSIPENPRLYF